MLKFPLWKKLAIFSVLVFGLVNALPNVLSEKAITNLPSFLPKDKINLGLDLQGGSHLVLEVDVDAAFLQANENLEDDIRNVLRRKGERIGYRGLKSDKSEVSFLVTNIANAEEAYKRLRKEISREYYIERENASFKIYLTDDAKLNKERYALEQTLEILRSRVDEFGVSEPVIQRQGTRRIIIELPGVEDASRAKSIIGRTAMLSFHLVDTRMTAEEAMRRRAPAGTKIYYEQVVSGDGQVYEIPYLLKRRPALTGENLNSASAGFDESNRPAIFIGFDTRGTRKFADLTTKHVGERMAIVLDGKVYSAPNLREPILGGNASITGSFSVKETEDLAAILRAGALPAPVKVIEERTIGPSLGADSVNAGTTAVALGFIAVLVVMVLFYLGFGLAANMALLANVVLIVGVMTALGATLTLPGIAGIVLTIGMAVDANVLIFERIREETRAGRKPTRALEEGFKSAFGTILDANITTLIAAVVLFAIGSGPIKGFALTLSVGIATSIFTATMVTRFILVAWIKTVKPKKLKA